MEYFILLFKIVKNHGCTSIVVNPEVKDKLALSKVQVLTEFDANETVDAIIAGTTTGSMHLCLGLEHTAFGVLILGLAEYFCHGIELEKETEGLI